jgi:site-specific DNA-methyltransferase (adenine-specific)
MRRAGVFMRPGFLIFIIMDINKIYNENCLDTMSRMQNNYIDLTVTSPPYDNLRQYNGYSFPFEDIAKELFRVTKQGGVVVWVVGDATVNGSETGTSFRQALFFMQCGFSLHDTMIYSKTPSFPAAEGDKRYSQSFEYMFIFSKGEPMHVTLLKDRKNKWGGSQSWGKTSERKKDGTIKEREKINVQEYGFRFNNWEYATGKGNTTRDEIAYKHPAMFPEKLAEDHILSWSNENDLVYDCFGGSGTTAKMAHKWKRNWILSEISSEYCDIAEKRLKPYLSQGRLV